MKKFNNRKPKKEISGPGIIGIIHPISPINKIKATKTNIKSIPQKYKKKRTTSFIYDIVKSDKLNNYLVNLQSVLIT